MSNFQKNLKQLADKYTQKYIADCTGFFDLCQRFNKFRAKALTGDLKIFAAPKGLNTVVGISGDFLCSNGILFQSIHNATNLS